MDGSIRIGTKLDLSGIKNEIKALEKELQSVQKEADKLTAKEEKVKETFSAEREIDSQVDKKFSHSTEIDKKEADALSQITAQQEALNQKKQEYNAMLDQANEKLQQQTALAQASKELDGAVKSGAILDKISTQEEYNSLLEQTRAKMATIEECAKDIANANNVSYEALLAANPTYQKLCDTMGVLTSTTRKFKSEAELAGKSAKKSLGKAKSEAHGLDSAIKKGIKTLARMSLAVLGVRGAYSLVRRAVTSCLSANEELANKMSAIWSTLGMIIEPVVELFINAIYKMLAYINYFVKALTGIDFIANANAKAINRQSAATDKLTKSTNAANKALASFDEMNVMSDPSTGGGTSLGSVATLDLPELTEEEMGKIDEIVTFVEEAKVKLEEIFKQVEEAIGWVCTKTEELVGWWQELDHWTQILIASLGVAGLVGILTGSGGVAGAIIIVGGALAGLNALINGDTTDAINGCIILFGVGGLVGILTGKWGVAASIMAVSLALMGLVMLVDGDTTESILGFIALLAGAGLAGYLWFGVKGVSVGIAIASVIAILNGLNKLFSGDTTTAITGVIQILMGSAGLVVAFKTLKAVIAGESGVTAALTALKSPLFLCLAGFAVLAAGILYLSQNWDKMSGAQRAITILTALAAAAAAAAIAIAVFQTSWTVGIAAAAIVGGLALLGLTFAFSSGKQSELQESGQAMAQGFYSSSNFTGNPLPELAVGGIVNRPGRGVPAIIGEAGPEAVLPLDGPNADAWMDVLADKIGGNVTIPIYMDGKKIATYVVDIQKKKAFAMNGA